MVVAANNNFGFGLYSRVIRGFLQNKFSFTNSDCSLTSLQLKFHCYCCVVHGVLSVTQEKCKCMKANTTPNFKNSEAAVQNVNKNIVQ